MLTSIATTIEDYRDGELDKPTPEHVDQWINQFDEHVQLPMLREMNHVLNRTYFSLSKVTRFLRALITNKKLTGDDPSAFWRSVNFLNIQQGGNSQREMLELFEELLKECFGFHIHECGNGSTVYCYLDDGLFTGNRVRRDLETWITNQAPNEFTLHNVFIALHSGGLHYAGRNVNEALKATGKECCLSWWRAMELEDRRSFSHRVDVLRPTSIPNDSSVRAYVEAMQYPPTLRRPGNIGSNALFRDDEGKQLLEQEFLKAGSQIRILCPNLGNTQRPLGHISLDTLGFGSLFVTFRNCPNNAPLALWVGHPWYPLFPRTTNSQTAIRRMFDDLTGGGS